MIIWGPGKISNDKTENIDNPKGWGPGKISQKGLAEKSEDLLFSALKSENGRLTVDKNIVAQSKGFIDVSDEINYKAKYPDLYEAMGGIKYIEPGTKKNGLPSAFAGTYDHNYATNLSNTTVSEIKTQFNSTDTKEIDDIIEILNSGEWQDTDTMKKYSDKINSYVNNFIALNELGYFDSVLEADRKANVESLKTLKEVVNSRKDTFADFSNADDFNKAIWNDKYNSMTWEELETAEQKIKDGLLGKNEGNDNASLQELHYIKKILANQNKDVWDGLVAFKKLSDDEQSDILGNVIYGVERYEDAEEYIVDLKKHVKYSEHPEDTENVDEYIAFVKEWYNEKGSTAGAREAYGIRQGYVNDMGQYRKENENNSQMLDFADTIAFYETKYGSKENLDKLAEQLTEYHENKNTNEEFVKYYTKMQSDPNVDKYITKGKEIYKTKDENISDEEYEVACYYLGKDGNSDDYYFTWLEDTVYKREVAAAAGWSAITDGTTLKYHRLWSDYTKSAPLEANAMSVAMNLGAGAEFAYNTLNGNVVESKLSKASSKIREAYSNTHDWNILGFDAHDFLYNTAMSGVDSLAAMGFGSGGSYILGLSAAAAGVNDALDRGMSNEQAFWNGLMSGVFECIFEKYSIEQLQSLQASKGSGLWTIIKNLSKTMLTNATEETATEVANIAYDTIINGDLSNYHLMVRQYMDSGLSNKEAIIKTALQFGKQVVEAGASGALMGFGFGFLGNTSASMNAAQYGKHYYGFSQKSVYALVDNGLAMSEGSAAYSQALKANARLKSGKSLSGTALYNLATAIESEIETKSTARLNELGVDKKTVKELSPVVAKAVFGEQLTVTERSELNNSNIAAQVVKELLADRANTVWRDAIKNSRINNATDSNAVTEQGEILQSTAGNVADSSDDIARQGAASAEIGSVPNNPDRAAPGVVEGLDGRQYFDDGSGDEYYGNDYASTGVSEQAITARRDPALDQVIGRLASGENIDINEISTIPKIVELCKESQSREQTYTINTPERKTLRQKILNMLLAKGSAVIDNNGKVQYNGEIRQEYRADIVIGLSAAGKSSVLVDPLSEFYKSRVIDSDMAKELLPEFDNGLGANAVHIESQDIIANLLADSVKNGDNIVHPIVGGHYESLVERINHFKENGYTVYLHLNELSNSKAIGRSINRYVETGRFIPPEIIAKYKDKPTENFNKIINTEGLVDGYSHYSNDVARGEKPKLVKTSENVREFAERPPISENDREFNERRTGHTNVQKSSQSTRFENNLNNFTSEATSQGEAASFIAENSGAFELNEPMQKDIARAPSAKEAIEESITGKQKTNIQRHITDVCKKLDSKVTVEFVDGLKTNGKYIRSQNKILIRSDLNAVQMYVEVFKHEFMHRLETKQLYSKFFNFCFKKSKAFEQYVRTELKTAGVDVDAATREGVLEAYTNYKYEQYKNSRDILKVDRDAFTKENAQEEIITDFFAQILFQGKKYRARIIEALQNADGEALIGVGDEVSSEAALMELQQKEPTLFEQVVQWFKDVINRLRGLPQAKSLVEQLDNEINQLESMARRAYQSKDSKQQMKKKMAAEKYHAVERDSNGNSYWQIETEKDIFKGIKNREELKKAAYNYILKGDKGDKVNGLIDGENLQFIRVSAKEYVYGIQSQKLSPEAYKQKMRMSTSIIDLIDNADIKYDAPDHKNHKLFPDGFKNYQGRVGIDNTIFRYIVRVGKAKDGMIFYDINLEVDGKVPSAKSTSLIKTSTSNDSISNSNENVNTENSNDNSNDIASVKNSLSNDSKQTTEKYGDYAAPGGDIRLETRDGIAPLSKNAESNIMYSEREYSYETLINKPDMIVAVLDDNIPDNRADVVAKAKKNAAAVGKLNSDGSVSVYIDDINKEIVVGKKGLIHGLDRRFAENAKVTLQAGKIIKNSIKINELTPAKYEANESYVLIGAAVDTNGKLNIVRFVVNQFSNELLSMDVLYAINAKKESTAVLNAPLDSTPDYRTTISISKLLDYVNKYFPDILPESVLRHYGYDARPEGKLGESALFSMPIGKRKRKIENNLVELSRDNELSKKIGDLRGAAKYKVIQQYILDVLSGQEIVLSDGKIAVVDKSDAQHIARGAGDKKTTQISDIKKIIEKAVLVAEENSTKERKFDYFCYYEAKVKYDGETFNVYLNVGRATNDKSYHIYDITQKLRDTAHRLNDVGRPPINKGCAVETVSLNNIVPKTAKNVNNDYSTNTDNIEYDAISEQEQKYIQTICDKLGRTVVFEDLREMHYKGEIISPDGYIKNGVIHLNLYAENPIGFVFKHELTHFAEKASGYAEFARGVKDSKVYKKWLCEKMGESDVKIAEYKYKRQVVQSHSDIYSANDSKAEAEMIADFVGEMLFTDNGSGMASLVSDVEVKHRNKVVQYVLDLISYLKKKLSGIKALTLELSRLEDRFNELLFDAKNSSVNDNEVKFSFAGSRGAEKLYDTLEVLKPENDREWSEFNRQFANKTSDLKNNKQKNIIICTENNVYFVSASGYMAGCIEDKVHIDGNEENINEMIKEYSDGTFAIGKIFSSSVEEKGREYGRGDRDIIGTEGRDRQSENVDLDERQPASDDVAYNWENYGYKTWEELIDAIDSGALIMDDNGNILAFEKEKYIKATLDDEVAFSMPIGKRKSKVENNVVELSKDNELSKKIGDLRGAAKYKVIQQYILDVLSGQEIVLSDGKIAVVDKSDALHIANKAANKKTAQISAIKELVEKAVLIAEEESNKGRKFDYFYYYGATVKYDGEIFNVYLNVGRATNNGEYHIYDITNKIRDTANRINGLERPKPNEGYALTNGISNNSIPKTAKNVNNDYSTNTDNIEYDAINEQEQKYIQTICDKLGSTVVFEDLREMHYKGKIISPDGYIENGVIHLNLYAENPIGFVFKHELTHFAEKASGYAEFARGVKDSKVYKKWLCEKMGESDVKIAEYKYKRQVVQSHSDIYSASDPKAEAEMIADFVGEMLFTDNGSGMASLVSDVEVKHRNKVVQFVVDFISWLKKKVGGIKSLTLELSRLEDGFNELLSDAKNMKDSGKYGYDDGFKFSLRIKHTDGTVEEIGDARNLTEEQAVMYLNQARRGELWGHTYIPVRKDTPTTIIDTLKAADIVVENCSLIMQVRKAQQAMSTINNGAKSKKHGNNIRNHAMSAEQIVEIVNNLDNPTLVILQTNRYNQYGEELPDNVAIFVEYNNNDNEGLAIVEFDSSIDSEFIGTEFGDTNYHTVVTIFEPDTERYGIPFDYAEELLSNPDNYELEIIRRQPTRNATQEKHPNTSNELPSDDIILDIEENVNQDRRQPTRSAAGEKHPNTSNELPSNDIVSNFEENVNKKQEVLTSDEVAFSMPVEKKSNANDAINEREQKYIQTICDKLGRAVVFEDLREMHYKGGIISPDGYIKNGVIHLNIYAENPIGFVFKHELTHFAEKASGYLEFARGVKNSKVYKKWLFEKMGESDIKIAEYKYRQKVVATHVDIYSVSDPKADAEMIADFVGEMLFTDNGSGMASLVSDVEVKHRNKVVQFVVDFISWLKKKVGGIKSLTLELSVLEDSFNRIVSEATEFENKGKLDYNDIRFSFNDKTNIDKYGFGQDNISRANKQGDLINEFYNALTKNEWKTFYDRIANSGYLATVIVGTKITIVINDKLIVAERKYTGKDAHDYAVIDAFQLQHSYDGDLLDIVKKKIDDGVIVYDRRTMYRQIFRILARNQSTGILTRFDGNSKQYVCSDPEGINGEHYDEIYGYGEERFAGDEISLRDRSDIRRDNGILDKNDEVTLQSEVAFSMPVDKRNDANDAISEQEQKYIQTICDKLGRAVVFEDLREMHYKGEIISPDGYIENGVIHLNLYAKKPIGFVLKHELTHFAEKASGYLEFARGVKNSKVYKKWLCEKMGKSNIKIAEYKYRQKVVATHVDIYSASDPKVEAEMIADFVGEMLFTDNGSGMIELVNSLEVKERNTVIKVILDFIHKIKKKLGEIGFVGFQIDVLEHDFTQLLLDASQLQDSASQNNLYPNFSVENRQSTIEKYSEEQYNNFGWVRYNDILTIAEYNTLLSRYADYKYNKNKYPTTRFGEAVIHSSECPDVLMYVKGEIDNPQITKIIRINKKDPTEFSIIREEILSNEYEQQLFPFHFIERCYGQEVLIIDKARDYASYREYGRRFVEGGSSSASNTFVRTEQDGRGSVGENTTVGGADSVDGSAFSTQRENRQSTIEKYSEEQYNNFGWVRYNDILTIAEYNTLLSRYADYKYNKNKYPTTRFGEAVIHSSECPDVLMYVKGNIDSPQITKIVRINIDEYNASVIKEEILRYEYRQVLLPYKNVEAFYGEGFFDICRRQDCISFREYTSRGKRGIGESDSQIDRAEQDGRGSVGENTTVGGADSVDGSAFSTQRENRQSTIEKYSEEQYNNFGWVRYNDILTIAEYNTLRSRYADYKHNKNIYPTTRFGEVVIHSSECSNVLMYVKGEIGNPQITKIIRINEDEYFTSIIKEDILHYEYAQVALSWQNVEAIYGEGILDINTKRDCASFRSYSSRTEGKYGKTNNTISGAEQDGRGSVGENTTVGGADSVDGSAFSINSQDLDDSDMKYCFAICNDSDVIEAAEQMEEEGESQAVIYGKLKVIRSAFGKWLSDLTPNNFKFFPKGNASTDSHKANTNLKYINGKTEGKLKDFISYKALFKRYPRLRNFRVIVQKATIPGNDITYWADENTIVISQQLCDDYFQNKTLKTKTLWLKTLQRIIQHIESRSSNISFEKWKSTVKEDEMPYSEDLGRRLTVEEAYNYLYDVYESENVANRYELKDKLTSSENRIKDMGNKLLYVPNIRDKALMIDENGKVITVKEYINRTDKSIGEGKGEIETLTDESIYENGQENQKNSSEAEFSDQHNELNRATSNNEVVSFLPLNEEKTNGSIETALEINQNSNVMRQFLTLSNKLDRYMFERTKIRSGSDSLISDVAENAREAAEYFNQEKIKELSNKPLNPFDTVGRFLNYELRQKLNGSFLKNEKGQIISLYTLEMAGIGGFKNSQLGLIAGTLESVKQLYSQYNENSSRNRRFTIKEIYVCMKNPLVLHYTPYELSALGVHDLVERGIITHSEYVSLVNSKRAAIPAKYDGYVTTIIRNKIKDAGYDGIIYFNDTTDNGSMSVAVFDPDQIVTVAQDGILQENNGITEDYFDLAAAEDAAKKINNDKNIKLYTADSKYNKRKYRPVPDERIKAGNSGFMEKVTSNTDSAKKALEDNLAGNNEIALSGKDTVGRNLGKNITGECDKTFLKDKNGNLLSFFAHGKKIIDLEKAIKSRTLFGTLDSAINDLVLSKEKSPRSIFGLIQEFYINSVAPLVVELDNLDAEVIARQIFEEGIITEKEYYRLISPERKNPALVLINKLDEKGFDSIVFVKKTGECAVLPFDASQVFPVADNGMLKEDIGVIQEDEIEEYNENYQIDRVVIEREGETPIDTQEIRNILTTEHDNTIKMKLITKVLMCNNNPAIDYSDNRTAGHSGILEKNKINIFNARAIVTALINRDSSDISIANTDTVGRIISEYKRQLLRESKLIDKYGRPLSVFGFNRYGDYRFNHSQLGLRVSTLNSAHDTSIFERENSAGYISGSFEEYYPIVKNPYFLMFDPENLTPAMLAKYLLEEGTITNKQHERVLARLGADKAAYNSFASNYLTQILKEKGFDCLAFMNERADPGSIGLIVFDKSQLIPVAIDGLPVENSDRTLADSDNEPAFLMPENDGENFVEKGKENTFDNDDNNGYNEIKKVKCRNERLEGENHSVTDVPFVKKQIEVDGKIVEVVVPEFDSLFDAQLPEELYKASNPKQFKECNLQLSESFKFNNELRKQFDDKQIKQIKKGKTPYGYTWHHDVAKGKMQLVDYDVHRKTGHTGGQYFWGGGTKNR